MMFYSFKLKSADQKQPISTNSDMYAFGMIAFEIFIREEPFPTSVNASEVSVLSSFFTEIFCFCFYTGLLSWFNLKFVQGIPEMNKDVASSIYHIQC